MRPGVIPKNLGESYETLQTLFWPVVLFEKNNKLKKKKKKEVS